MRIIVRMLCESEASVLEKVAEGVFDNQVQPVLARDYLRDPRLHLAVALDGETVVGMASAIHYIHPDKPMQLFINEVGVAPTHQRQGIGRRLVEELLRFGQGIGCFEAWVATEVDNEPARKLYAATGGVEDADRAVVFTYRLDSS